MSNANLPDRWIVDRRFRRDVLSDSAFRSYIAALMWSVANRTDGKIKTSDLPYIPNFDANDIPELIGGDLWEPRLGEWLIADYSATQSSRSLLESYEHKKAWDRDRKARQAEDRRADRDRSTGNSGGNSPNTRHQDQKPRSASAKPAAHGDSGGNSGGTSPVDSLQPTNQPTNPKAPKVPRTNATTRNGTHLRGV
jgi:hypothetical protein